ncbi:hypothetical protein MTO96_020211 [Rhipicephalus appendiculatus]
MSDNDLTQLQFFLRQLSATQLRFLNSFNHAWLPQLQDNLSERLATSICMSIYPCQFYSEPEFLQRLAWLHSWLIPQSVRGFTWQLYRRRRTPTPLEDFTLHERFMALIDYPGCRMTSSTTGSMRGLYISIITSDPEIRAPDVHAVICLSVWPGRPFLGVATSEGVMKERLDQALRSTLPGIPQEQLVGAYANYASMHVVVVTGCQ